MLLFLVSLSFSSFARYKVILFDITPFSYINKEGNLDGVVYKLWKEIEQESGLEFSYTLVPYARAIKLLSSGDFDLGMFYPSTMNNSQLTKLTATLGNINYLVSLKKNKVQSLSDIKEKKVALIRGASYSEEFDRLKIPGKVFVQNYSISMKMLLLNRVDLAVITSAAYEYFVRNDKSLDPTKFSLFTINSKQNWIHVRKGLDPKVSSKIKEANSIIIKSKKYKSLADLF